MNKKIIVTSLALMLGVMSFSATNAFGGERRGGGQEMTQEKFEEMKALFNKYTNVADFIAAKEALKESHKADREAIKESITKSVENITNGAIVTITSDDASVVEKIQSREARPSKNEEITKTTENITNGVKITITTDNADLVEKIQSHSARDGSQKKGKRNNEGRKGKRGQSVDGEDNNGGRFAKFRQRMMERFGSQN